MAVSLFANRPRRLRCDVAGVCRRHRGRSPIGRGTVLFAARSFFGVYRVIDAPDHSHHLLQHGSTTHGRQEMPADTSCEPTGYYHPSNPIGQLFASGSRPFRTTSPWWGSAAARWRAMRNPVTTGRSTRSIRSWSVSRAIHATSRYLQNSRGRLNVVLGDGRLTLQRANPGVRPDRPGRVQLRRHPGPSSDTRGGRAVLVPTQDRWRRGGPHLEPIPEARTGPRGARATRGLSALANLTNADAKNGRFASQWVLLSDPELAGPPGWPTRLVLADDDRAREAVDRRLLEHSPGAGPEVIEST